MLLDLRAVTPSTHTPFVGVLTSAGRSVADTIQLRHWISAASTTPPHATIEPPTPIPSHLITRPRPTSNMRQPGPNLEQLHRKTRLLSVLAATAIALSCGTNYAYSAWSPQFAEALHLSATSTNLIGNFGNIGMYAMGIPGGILIDKMGPRYGVMAGCVALACGYFPLRAAYVNGPAGGVDGAGDWFHPGVPALCFFALLTGMGSCTAFSAAIKVSATNWPQHRGTATAFPLSAFGLSAFFYTMVAGLAFPDDTAGYLLLLACGTTLMVFVGMFFLQIVHAQGGKGGGYEVVPGGEESRRLRRASSHSRHSSKGSMGENGKSRAQPRSNITHNILTRRC